MTNYQNKNNNLINSWETSNKINQIKLGIINCDKLYIVIAKIEGTSYNLSYTFIRLLVSNL